MDHVTLTPNLTAIARQIADELAETTTLRQQVTDLRVTNKALESLLEAKGASVAPTQADGSGPTREQMDEWFNGVWPPVSNPEAKRISFDAACRLCWQAAREGMVPKSKLDAARQAGRDSREPSEVQTRLTALADNVLDTIRAELTTTQDELRVCKSVRDMAEARVRELEARIPVPQELRATDELGTLYAKLRNVEGERDQLRADLENTKGDLATCRDANGSHIATAEHAIGEAKQLRADLAAAKEDADRAKLTALRARVVLPMSEAQREELAAVAFAAAPIQGNIADFGSQAEATQYRYRRMVDALAPRIARVGSEELDAAWKAIGVPVRGMMSLAEVIADKLSKRELIPVRAATAARELKDNIACTPDGHVVIDAYQFAKAIIERATGQESSLAPQDGVVVEYAVGALSDRAHAVFGFAAGERYWIDERGYCIFTRDVDERVTQALSATPGDKFRFSVVARRVE